MQRLWLHQRATERGGTPARIGTAGGWNRKNNQIIFFLIISWLLPAVTLAAPVQAQHVKVELLAETSAVAPGESLWMLLTFQAEQGWHTSWKNPGDTGVVPTLSWKLPTGWEAREPKFPTPSVIRNGEKISYGYQGDSALLVELVPPFLIQEKQVDINLDASWVVCSDTCVPGEGEFSLTLPVDRFAAVDLKYKKLFAQTRFKLPLTMEQEGIYQVEGDSILVDLPARTLPRKVSSIFIAPGNVAQAADVPEFGYEAKRLQFRLKRHTDLISPPAQIEVVLELAGQGWSVPARLKPL